MGFCTLGWGHVEDPDETGNTEPLNSDESSFPVGLAPLAPSPAKVASSIPIRRGISTPSDRRPLRQQWWPRVAFHLCLRGLTLHLPEKIVMASSDAVAM